jgi:uncharacterized protein YndB with AHSA1/START domain
MKTRIAITLLLGLICFNQSTTAGTRNSASRHGRFSADTPDIDRTIKLEIVVNAPAEKVWRAWTTRDGIKSFFAPDCDIDLRVLGKYDILFVPSAPVGKRGAEGNLVLAIQEGKMLSFTWDAPPTFPDIRKQRTSVVIRLMQLEQNKTKVFFTQSGWGEGEQWNKVHDYFVKAWGEIVLPYLKHSLEVGPIDWKNPPEKLEKAVSSRSGGID